MHVNITTENQDLIEIESTLILELNVQLEGAHNTGSEMNTDLTDILPCIQPYVSQPWNYGGSEEVNRQFFIDNNIIDWILVELRKGATASEATSVAGRRAGLVNKFGEVLDIDGTRGLKFFGVDPLSYFIVVKHRNHLSVISSSKVEWLP